MEGALSAANATISSSGKPFVLSDGRTGKVVDWGRTIRRADAIFEEAHILYPQYKGFVLRWCEAARDIGSYGM
jgi:hypothetical protein